MPLKLITPESLPRRIWFVLFLMTWLIFFVVGLTIYGGGYILLKSPPFSLWWLGVTPPVLSAYVASQATRAGVLAQREEKAKAERVPSEHAVLGPFYAFPYYQYWRALSVPTSLGPIAFAGPGLAPSDAQVAQCLQIIERLPRLVTEAVARLLPPPEPCVDAETCEFTPTEVALLENGDFELSLYAPLISDQIDKYPSAIFSEGTLRGAEWIP